MIKTKITAFIERVFYSPNIFDYFGIIILSPLSLIYGTIMLFRRIFAIKKDFLIPIISVGNLIVGGSGKTPFLIAIASRYPKSCIISRGYGRKSKGLIWVSQEGKILTDVESSGDEAMLIAQNLPQSSVIVSEDRQKAIIEAKNRGAKVIFLDDGFNKVDIKKFEILLSPKNIKNPLPFPAGAFREFAFSKRFSNLFLVEDTDFKREVEYENLTSSMLLVTAIANPSRLDKFLPHGVIDRYYLSDHEFFDEQDILEKMQKVNATSILVTQKDRVKMERFKLPISEIKLKLSFSNSIFDEIDNYIKRYGSKIEK